MESVLEAIREYVNSWDLQAETCNVFHGEKMSKNPYRSVLLQLLSIFTCSPVPRYWVKEVKCLFTRLMRNVEKNVLLRVRFLG